jgi:hypothetical protein
LLVGSLIQHDSPHLQAADQIVLRGIDCEYQNYS